MPAELKIYQYKKTGEFVREWKSLSDMCFFLKIQTGHIHEHIVGFPNGKKRSSVGGFIFTKTYYMKLPNELCYKRRKNTWSKPPKSKNLLFYKPIVQYDLNGKFIKLWDNASVASKELNIHYTNICDVLSGKYNTTKGFIFKKYENNIDDIDVNFKNPNKYNKIIQYDLKGKKIKIWNNINEASKELNISYNVIYCSLLGKTKKSKKYIWKYKTNPQI